jgi:DnaJ-class molecular chaperone
MNVTCNYCEGKGYYDTIGEYMCQKCLGYGVENGNYLMAKKEICRVCNGKGKNVVCKKEICPYCRGKGKN